MAGVADRHFVGRSSDAAKSDRRRARRRMGHGEAFAAARSILRGGGRDERAEGGKDDKKESQHGKSSLIPRYVSADAALGPSVRFPGSNPCDSKISLNLASFCQK